DPNRFLILIPPAKGRIAVETYGQAFFNAANLAVQSGQQEVFRSCLLSISSLAHAYTDRRSLYINSEDSAFGFLNDQFAALMKAAAKSSNESLITDSIRHIGFIAGLSLRIGMRPKSKKATS